MKSSNCSQKCEINYRTLETGSSNSMVKAAQIKSETLNVSLKENWWFLLNAINLENWVTAGILKFFRSLSFLCITFKWLVVACYNICTKEK